MSDIDFDRLLRPAPSVFVDDSVFSPEYQDPFLEGRKTELMRLASYFRALIVSPGVRSQSVILQGPPGTGKTLVMRTFCNQLSRHMAGQRHRPSDPRFRYLVVDCLYYRTPYGILTWLLQQFIPNFPLKGFQMEILLGMLNSALYEQNLVILLCFTNIDSFPLPERQELLYAFSRSYEVVPAPDQTPRLNFLILTHDPDFLTKLDLPTRSSLGNSTVYFPPYTPEQLRAILSKRATTGLTPQAWNHDLLHYIAQKTVAYGIHYALTVLYQAGKLADTEQASQILQRHVDDALTMVPPRQKQLNITKLVSNLALHPQFILRSIVHIFNGGADVATTPEITRLYRQQCGALNEQPRGATQIWAYLKSLTELGIVHKQVVNRHARGKSKGRVAMFRLGKDIDMTELDRALTP